ncbi:methyltransferase domain-containing protein [Coralliovum pocilloporae]|uniref:methyltransferase domain-containing protein n=1 Tax=Coralliovum pocilloporae TaxID=3066369 RepID=UPI0033079043
MTSRLFNRQQQFAIQARALRYHGNKATFLYEAAVDDILDRLSVISRDFAQTVALTDPTGYLSTGLRALPNIGQITRTAWSQDQDPDLVTDEEVLPFSRETLNLIVSPIALQWANDLPGILIQARRALKPDGLLIGSMLGGETLYELRDVLTTAELELRDGAALRVIPSLDIQTMGGLLQRTGFSLPVIDQDAITVRYSTFIDLIRDIRAMGGTSAFADKRTPALNRSILHRAEALYQEKYSDSDGRIRATFQIISFSGWAPHESQQRPLEPGGAKQRLEDAVRAFDKDK